MCTLAVGWVKALNARRHALCIVRSVFLPLSGCCCCQRATLSTASLVWQTAGDGISFSGGCQMGRMVSYCP